MCVNYSGIQLFCQQAVNTFRDTIHNMLATPRLKVTNMKYFYYVKLITAQPFVKIQHLATIFEVVNKCTVQCRWDDHTTQ